MRSSRIASISNALHLFLVPIEASSRRMKDLKSNFAQADRRPTAFAARAESRLLSLYFSDNLSIWPLASTADCGTEPRATETRGSGRWGLNQHHFLVWRSFRCARVHGRSQKQRRPRIAHNPADWPLFRIPLDLRARRKTESATAAVLSESVLLT
jgi:hypothetical protein